MNAGGRLAAGWAITGVGALFLFAIVRLGARGISVVASGLGPSQWAVFGLLLLLFVVFEGRAALQARWVPMLVRRARDLRGSAAPSHRLLAPLYGMSLVGASPRRLVRAWLGTLAVIVAILLVRVLPDPWRGLIDLSVAAALAWGLGALLIQAPDALRTVAVEDRGP
ncbi:MAG TPA: hypothetical protein VK858_14600 [Longimicrobiales bacterium]|nr:hypothetical protein [Longimicrobiales bacterium]